MATYAQPADLRDVMGFTEAQLPDTEATRLIESAEDIIDALLGDRAIDTATGRKVEEADEDVLAWQWTKLGRATVKLAARLHANPELDGIRYDSVSGEFSVGRVTGAPFGEDVEALLNQSGLRRLTFMTGARSSLPPWYDFAYNVERD